MRPPTTPKKIVTKPTVKVTVKPVEKITVPKTEEPKQTQPPTTKPVEPKTTEPRKIPTTPTKPTKVPEVRTPKTQKPETEPTHPATEPPKPKTRPPQPETEPPQPETEPTPEPEAEVLPVETDSPEVSGYVGTPFNLKAYVTRNETGTQGIRIDWEMPESVDQPDVFYLVQYQARVNVCKYFTSNTYNT